MRVESFKNPLLTFLAMVAGLGIVLTAITSPAGGQEKVFDAFVTRVIDGDTIIARIDFGDRVAVERVRFAGIDAPEVTGDESAAGLESGRFLREMIDQEPVVLIVHISSTGRLQRGKYGRLIARVLWCGDDVGEIMVSQGLAEYY